MANNKKRYYKKPVKRDNYVPPFNDAVLSEPVSNLSLRSDTLELLSGANVTTIADVVKRMEVDFYRICHFNKQNLNDVKNALKKRNLFLRPTPPPPTTNAESEVAATEQKPVAQNRQKPVVPSEKPQTQANGNNNRAQTQKPQQKKPNGKPNNEQNAKPEQNKKAQQQPQNDSAQTRQNRQNKPNGNKPQKKQPEQPYVMKTIPEKPPKPVHVPVKEEQDIYVKINKGGKWGFRTRDGKEMAVPAVYDEVFNFKDDLCCVQKEEKFGFINRQGEEIIPVMYDCATSFSEGYACVFKGEYCGYINTANETIIDFVYSAGTPVINGECRVKKDGKWGELHIDAPKDIRWII